MPRGYPVHVERIRPGKVTGTCGKCPCCRARAKYNTKQSKEYNKRKALSDSISDEELERRLNAKFAD